MPEQFDDLIHRIRQKHLGEQPSAQQPQRQPGKLAGVWKRIKDAVADVVIGHKLAIVMTGVVIIAGLLLLLVLTQDYLTKRQNYPERNVLFRSSSVMYLAGGSEEKNVKQIDQQMDTQVYEGGGSGESKVGTFLFSTIRESRDDIEYFNMDNSQKIRIASATRKPEIVQAGLRIGGCLDFKEQFAEILMGDTAKTAQSYRVYKFVPERGLKEVEVTIVERANGSTVVENRMIEYRSFPLGWLWGKEFRAGTSLDQYLQTPENQTQINRIQTQIKTLDSQQTVDVASREKMIRDAMYVSEHMTTAPIYRTYEDGIFDLLPQESTVYLAHNPGIWERLTDSFLGKSTHIRLRIENYWDLFPGRYPLLRNFQIGKGENATHPFDKYNNGGYIIKDQYGDLARVDIHDFILFYGQDVLYSYYLDLNGDGKLDATNELLGTVLCRTTHDERLELEKLIGEGRPKADVTFTLHYSFMAPPNATGMQGMEYFNLCGQIESLMPDQINRGYGKHSLLGYINEQRSDIMLFKNLTIENMSRSLTQESTLVANHDIINVLIAAKRPYAKELAEKFGVTTQFEGRYQTSELLRERRDWSQLLGGAVVIALVVGAYVLMRRNKRASSVV